MLYTCSAVHFVCVCFMVLQLIISIFYGFLPTILILLVPKLIKKCEISHTWDVIFINIQEHVSVLEGIVTNMAQFATPTIPRHHL